MKTVVVFCLALAMLAGCTATSQPTVAPAPRATAPAAEMQSVNSENGKASLAYPAAWKVISAGTPLVVGDAPLASGKSSPAAAGPAHYAALLTQPTDPQVPPTRSQLVDMARSDLGSACTSAQLSAAAEDVQIDGRPGIWLYCHGQIDGRPVHASIAYAERTGMMVGLFALAYDDAPWAQLKPTYQQMIAGLKFVK